MRANVVILLLLCSLPLSAQAQVGSKTVTKSIKEATLEQLIERHPRGARDFRVGDMIFRVTPRPLAKGASRLEISTWTNGVVYYTFSPVVSDSLRSMFKKAFRAWETTGVVRFIPRPEGEPNYVNISVLRSDDRRGGYAHVGMIRGSQDLVVKADASYGILLHEIGHTLGLLHEHQRSDRDQFITIYPDNVHQEFSRALLKVESSVNCTDYDFLSVMHYSPRAFSINGGLTIKPLPDYSNYFDQMGQRRSTSQLDLEAVRKLYTEPECQYTPGDELTMEWSVEQRMHLKSHFPESEIAEAQGEGLWIDHIKHDGSQWALALSSLSNANEQVHLRSLNTFSHDDIQHYFEKDYRITEASFADGGWSIVMSMETGFTGQSYAFQRSFPQDDFRALWKEDYRITDMTHAEGMWLLVMSQNSGFGHQVFSSYSDRFPRNFVDDKWDEGYVTTEVLSVAGNWMVVATKQTGIRDQIYRVSSALPTSFVEENWRRGYRVTVLSHEMERWVVVMSR